jgi:hypothetical protein
MAGTEGPFGLLARAPSTREIEGFGRRGTVAIGRPHLRPSRRTAVRESPVQDDRLEVVLQLFAIA